MLLTVASGRSDDGLDEPMGRALQGGYRLGSIQHVYTDSKPVAKGRSKGVNSTYRTEIT